MPTICRSLRNQDNGNGKKRAVQRVSSTFGMPQRTSSPEDYKADPTVSSHMIQKPYWYGLSEISFKAAV